MKKWEAWEKREREMGWRRNLKKPRGKKKQENVPLKQSKELMMMDGALVIEALDSASACPPHVCPANFRNTRRELDSTLCSDLVAISEAVGEWV
jgi:hypothetical protein